MNESVCERIPYVKTMSDEQTESDEPDGDWKIPDSEDCSLEQIEKHITTHIGKIDTVWHELISNILHIDVHQIAPTDERPYWSWVTSGMSDLPMPAPEGSEYWRHAELMICLPRDWPVQGEEADQERHYWPMRWLKMLARFPHEYETWLAWGHTMPNGDPPEPFAEDTDFSGIILLSPKTVSNDFWSLKVREDKILHFYSLVPLYEEEMNLKLKQGAHHLDDLLEKAKVTELVDINRKNVAKGKWWKPW